MSSDPPESPIPSSPALIDESNMLGSVIRVAWPVVVQQASLAMVQLVDTALVGQLGEDELAGVRLAGQMLWFAISGMLAVAVGATAIVSRAVGAGQEHRASDVLQTAFVLAFAWGVMIALAMWFLGHWGLGMLGAEPGAQEQGYDYLQGIAVGMPFFALVFAGNAAQQGSGDTRSPMWIGLAINVVNGFLSYFLINGTWIFPRLEVLGSAIGFSVAAVFGALLVLGVLASGTRTLTWSPRQMLTFQATEARRLLNVGVPSGLEQLQFNVAFMIYTRIIASLGTTALAAHGVTLAIQSLTFNIGFALSIATSALVGQSLGAQRPDLAEKASYMTMRYSLAFTCTLGVAFMLFGGQITDIFVSGPDAEGVIDIGRDLLFIFAFAMPGLAVSLSLSGALRGAGDTRSVLYIMAGSTWIVRLIPAYILAIPLGLGVPGAWLAAILDINIRTLLMTLRFRQGKWKQIEV